MATPIFASIAAFIGATFVGCSPIFVRFANLGALPIAFHRFALALPFLFLWWIIDGKGKGQGVSKRTGVIILLTGVAFALDVVTWNFSLEYTAVVNSALFNNFAAFFVPLFVWWLFAERPRRAFVMGASLALIGALLLAAGKLTFSKEALRGDLLALLSAIFFSAYLIGIQHLRKTYRTSTTMLGTTLTSALCLGVMLFFCSEPVKPPARFDWGILLALALLTHLGGQGLLAFAMKRVSAKFSALTLLVGPVVAASFAWAFFEESMTGMQIFGSLTILGSLVFVQLADRLSPCE